MTDWMTDGLGRAKQARHDAEAKGRRDQEHDSIIRAGLLPFYEAFVTALASKVDEFNEKAAAIGMADQMRFELTKQPTSFSLERRGDPTVYARGYPNINGIAISGHRSGSLADIDDRPSVWSGRIDIKVDEQGQLVGQDNGVAIPDVVDLADAFLKELAFK